MNGKECKRIEVVVVERVYHHDAGFAPGAPGQSEVGGGDSAESHLNVEGLVPSHFVGGVEAVEGFGGGEMHPKWEITFAETLCVVCVGSAEI